MAATRLIPMHVGKGRSLEKSLKAKIEYAINPDKTHGGELVSSYGCQRETASEEFYFAKSRYEQKTGKIIEGDVIAYQIRQSFKPGEITPEDANRIGYETAMRFTHGNHAFIVATHTDRAHIHNHIVFNSTSMDCKRKFKNFYLSAFVLQKISDLLCLENGLSVIKPRPYGEREKRTTYPKYNGFRDEIRNSISIALGKRPADFNAFLLELQSQGYEIKRGKHIAVRGKGQKRFIRFRSLGDGFTEADLREKLEGVSHGTAPKSKRPSYMDKDFDLLINLQDVIAKGKGPGYELWAKKYKVKNVMKAILFFQEQGLRSYAELAERAEGSAKKFNELDQTIKSTEKRLDEISKLRNHIINYSKTRDIYTEYRRSGYSKKYFAEHKDEIMKHKAAKDAFDKLGTKRLPTMKELDAEFQEVLAKKRAAYSEYRDAKGNMTKYQIAKYDIDRILGITESPEQNKTKQQESSR